MSAAKKKSKVLRDEMLNETALEGSTALEEVHDILNPTIKISIDEFHLIKVIGRGTFGKVFMVRKKDTNMIYAMKVLKKE